MRGGTRGKICLKDVCVTAFLDPYDLTKGVLRSAAISVSGCFFGLRSVIVEVYLLKVIVFAAMSKVYERAAMTICAWVLTTPKYRTRSSPNSRCIVSKHCSTPKRCLEISLLKRFCDGRGGQPRTTLCKISPRSLPLKSA